MKNFDTIILGGGASGCMCALVASKKGQKVAIIDKEIKPAKKILATGNGRCNLTNINMSSEFYNQKIDKFLCKFSTTETLQFFKNLGLETYFDEEGRVYPLSNNAKSVLDIISLSLNENNVSFFGDTTIQNVNKSGNSFIVKTDKEDFCARKIVFALGGQSIIKANEWFGENITTPCPSLVALKTDPHRSLSGVKISNCKARAISSNGQNFSQKGEVLFKDSGLSGICIFNLSSIFARHHKFDGKISLDLLPDFSEKKVKTLLLERKNLPRKIGQIFDGLLNSAVGYEILNRVKLDENKPLSKLTNTDVEKLAYAIKNLEFNVKDCYDNNQIFSGGVKLNALTDSLESKKTKNLFFVGEACDVDGICGGYNLQWAWTSGYIAGENL